MPPKPKSKKESSKTPLKSVKESSTAKSPNTSAKSSKESSKDAKGGKKNADLPSGSAARASTAGSKRSAKSTKGSGKNEGSSSLFSKLFSCFRRAAAPAVGAGGDEQAREQALLEQALGVGDGEEPQLVVEPADVQRFVCGWGADYLNTALSDHALACVRAEAAAQVQRVLRGFLGRRAAAYRFKEAVADFTDFWNCKHENKMNDKEIIRKRQLETKQFAAGTVQRSVSSAISDQQRIDAATRIQSRWRGHVVRQVFGYLRSLHKLVSPYKIRKVERKLRIGPDARRVLWARRYYEPARGWPGKADFVDYDMWEHADLPPKGRDYGLKTHKVKAVPGTAAGKDILRSDKNAWVAVPISIVTEEEARPVPGPHVQRMVAISPYRAPLAQRALPEAAQGGGAQQTRLSGAAGFLSVGWSPSMIDRSRSDDEVVAKVKAAGITGAAGFAENEQSMLSYLGDADTLPQPHGSRLSPGAAPGGAAGAGAGRSADAASFAQNQSYGSASLIQEFKPIDLVDVKTERHVRKTMDVPSTLDTVSQVDAVTLWHSKGTYLSVRKEADATRTKNSKVRENVGSLKGSSWGKIKAVVENGLFTRNAVIAPGKNIEQHQAEYHSTAGPSHSIADMLTEADNLGKKKSRTSVWPTKPKPHYKLRYTWLPQPMVKSAVETLYYNDDGTEKCAEAAPFGTGSPPRAKNRSVAKSSVFDPDFDLPPEERARTARPDDDASTAGSSRRLKSPKRTAKMSMLINNMNTLSVLSTATEFDNKSAANRYARTQSPKNKTASGKASHPYHWL